MPNKNVIQWLGGGRNIKENIDSHSDGYAGEGRGRRNVRQKKAVKTYGGRSSVRSRKLKSGSKKPDVSGWWGVSAGLGKKTWGKSKGESMGQIRQGTVHERKGLGVTKPWSRKVRFCKNEKARKKGTVSWDNNRKIELH